MEHRASLAHQSPRSGRSKRIVLAVVCLSSLAAVVVFGLLMHLNDTAAEASCRGRLGQLALALEDYRQDHGTLPPAYVADKEGNPMHSWRVLLLPYLGEEELYKQYDFSEPWNGPHNRALAESGSAIAQKWFRCPKDVSSTTGWTNYVAVVGSGTLWPGIDTVNKQTYCNNSRQFLLTEIKSSGIHWMEPRDLSLEQASSGLVSTSPHRGKVNFVTADGLVGTLCTNTITFRDSEPRLLEKWLRISTECEGE
jgi:type II secretory pathway pseudopilin PulG